MHNELTFCIYIYICIFIHIYICIYIYRIENNVFLQKDAHGFTGHFASPEKFIRVELKGWTIKITFAKHRILPKDGLRPWHSGRGRLLFTFRVHW